MTGTAGSPRPLDTRIAALALSLFGGVVGAGVACSSSSPSAGSPSGDASVPDTGAILGDAGTPTCLLCADAANLGDASLGMRAYDQMLQCDSVECHGGGIENLTFVPSDPPLEVIDVPSLERPSMLRVKPGDPLQSYLYLKVWGDGGIDGSRMPANATVFDPTIPDLFFAWIEAGCPAPDGALPSVPPPDGG